MNTITLLQPSRIVFGNGCAAQCADFLLERNLRRILVVSSSSAIKSFSAVLDLLQSNQIEVAIAHVKPEPTISDFEEALQIGKGFRPTAVVGVGGGSPLDVAKLIAALLDGSQNIRDVFGIGKLQARKLPLICLPTTAGTGSEVSPNAILLDETEQLKKGVVSPHLVPDAAFVDPVLTVSVPPKITAYTGVDALVHCIEAFANRFAHPTVDLYALQGIRLITNFLERAVKNGADLEARENVALGSLYGGLCLGPVNTAAVHALAYPLGGEFRIAHGLANAVLLPHVLTFNINTAPERYAEIAAALGLEKNSPLEMAKSAAQKFSVLSCRCGIPIRLSDLNIPEEAIPRMAKSAMSVTRLLK
ncbi:MAG: iron-containing alcohol dehydrogenase, partial [Verrucomicrobiota bacterium]